MNLEETLYREDIELAPLSARFFAFLIDKNIIAFLLIVIYWDAFSQYQENYSAIVALILKMIWQLIILNVIYETVFLFLYGGTPGKMLLKIRVVNVSVLDSPNFLCSLNRAVVKTISEHLGYIPYAFVFFSPFLQAFHDYTAQTIVIKNA